MAKKRTNKISPTRFTWFFGYHVFDILACRRAASKKPICSLPTVCIAPLASDGEPDLDLAKVCDPRGVAILGRVPIGDGGERYLLVDGYETAVRCMTLGRPLRVAILSLKESRACRIAADSSGEWTEHE